VRPDIEVPAVDAFAEAYRRALEEVVALPAGPERRSVTDEAREELGSPVNAG
jgi:hypothetical protein